MDADYANIPDDIEGFDALADLPLQSADEQTRMWQQQGQYMLSDSGIHSVMSGTSAPSVCSQPIGGSDELEAPWPSGPGHPGSVGAVEAAFPPSDLSGMLSPGTPLSSSGGTTNTPIPLDQGIGGPASNLTSIGGNFDEASDLADAASALPELVPLLEDEDPVVVGQASMMINQLSKTRPNLEIIINTPGMVEALVRSLDTAAPEPARWLAGTLHQMSQTPGGLAVIFKTGGVAALIRQLSSNIEVIQFYSITTLHNLLLYQDGAKEQVRECGGIPVIVGLLKKNNQKFLAICTDCLQLLSFRHPQTKLEICSAGGPVELVHILLNYNYEKLLWTTTRVLKVLSVCPESKVSVIRANGIDALTKHLTRAPHEPRGPNPSPRLLHNCLWTLRNLSDAATSQEIAGPLFERLINLLASSDHTVVSCSAGILSNLTCNNQKSKQQVCASGGIKALIEAIKRSNDQEDIIEPCVCALRHLTVRHDEACRAQESVRFFDGLSVLSRLFDVTTTLSVRKAIINLVRNLALCPGNCADLREKGVVAQLCGVLQSAYRDMQVAANGCPPETASGRIRASRCDDLAEACCGALQLLARDPDSRAALSQHCCQLLCQLLFLPTQTEAVPRAALGLLWELSSQQEVPNYLASHGVVLNRLAELAQHGTSEPCRQYAALLLQQQQQQQQAGSNSSNMMQNLLVEASPPLPMPTMPQQPPPPPQPPQHQQQMMYQQQGFQTLQHYPQPLQPQPQQQQYQRMPVSMGSYPMMQQQQQPPQYHHPGNNGNGYYTLPHHHGGHQQHQAWQQTSSSSGHSSGFASPMQHQHQQQHMYNMPHSMSGGHTPMFED
ncbi:hypothetical protein BOX15_Mlig023492g2 [Macrostomum lignano]|uniref:Armadillo segment polarity protein n=2 Tax=Macrostomum lignano TaxID=282301 RepID=A0A267GM78_9PLAT|nr:hypothetical protein BOX15_Mlig023492g2 [Macrostomum lignano]